MFWLENLKGRDYSKDLGIDGRLILDWMLGKFGEKSGLEASGSGQGPVVVPLNTVMNIRVA
jgi:hypothetical protein